MSVELCPRGRLAPSPTGAQHIGNARTYLIAWLHARSRNAELRLRIEDIDSPRVKPGASQLIFDDLKWLGLDWDGEIVVQSDRITHYDMAMRQLIEKELVYPCTCSRSDVAAAASAPHLEDTGPSYPGTCAYRRAADSDRLNQPFSWRFRVTDSPEFVDGFLGPTRINLSELGGDFVIWKSAGTPAYQLAVVVDDAEMGISEVVRGDDLVASTPRQLLIYRALGLTPPHFFHVPLVVGTDGRRLAKRHGDSRIISLRNAGISPHKLIGLLAWSCGWIDKPTAIAARELISLFRMEAIPTTPFVVTPAHLQSIGYEA